MLGVEYKTTPQEVARAADIVSVHLALKPDTKLFIGADTFNSMREGAYFINTSRGEVVDQAALVNALQTRGIRAGLDVYAAEPSAGAGEFADAIAKETNLYGTHHIGASTDQAQEAIAAESVRITREFKETGKVPNVINLARHTPATHRLVVRHLDRPGVLARVVDGDRLTIGFVDIDPDVQVPEHRHENEQVGFVLRGSVTMVVDGNARELRVGETYTIASGLPHSAKAGKDGVSVVDVFAPVREDWKSKPTVDAFPGRWP